MVLESRYKDIIHTSPILISVREHCENGGPNDDEDIEATEEADEEANADLAGAALENVELSARPS